MNEETAARILAAATSCAAADWRAYCAQGFSNAGSIFDEASRKWNALCDSAAAASECDVLSAACAAPDKTVSDLIHRARHAVRATA